MTMRSLTVKKSIGIASVALFVFVSLSVGTSLTKRPWSDEGWFAAAGYNLAVHGKPGTLVLEPRGYREGLDRYTYWTAPLYYPLQAGWYLIFGVTVFSMRMLSTAFGVLLLICCYMFARKLLNRPVALLVLCLLAVDYVLVMGASFGRMDIICTAFGYAALAVYLAFRDQNLTIALFSAQALVVLSGLTHFLGILYFVGLWITVVHFDRSKLNVSVVAVSFIPYFVGAASWGLYIFLEPTLFVSQFFGNAQDSGRLSALANPLMGIEKEITERYMVAYGLGSHSVGSTGPVWLKSLVLVAYAAGLAMLLAFEDLREEKNLRLLFLLTFAFFIILTILDGQKLSYYLLNIVPMYTIALATAAYRAYRRFRSMRSLVVIGLAGIIVLQTLGLIYRMSLNLYSQQYGQAVSFLLENRKPGEVVMGSAEMAFALGFEGEVIDDHWLAYGKKRLPDYFVLEEVYEAAHVGKRHHLPEVYEYIISTITNEYKIVYDKNGYRIYKRWVKE